MLNVTKPYIRKPLKRIDRANLQAAAVAVPYLSGVAKSKIVPGSDTDLWK